MTSRQPDTTLPTFELMLSRNAFINNNLRLQKDKILPEWVDWIQLGKPTPKQLKYHPNTVANFRMLTNGRFMVCGRAQVENNQIEIESWTRSFMIKINDTIRSQGKKISVVSLSDVTRSIVKNVCEAMAEEMHQQINEDGNQANFNIDVKEEASKELALQSFFWKTELNETPPPLEESLIYSADQIVTEFSK